MIRDYGLLKEHGLLPVAGGYLDQAPTFMEAVELIDDIAAELRAKAAPNGA